MTITSTKFLIALLILIAVYYLVPKKCQWLILLAASLGFYSLGGLKSLCFLFFTIITTYAAGLALWRLDKKTKKPVRKLIVAAAMILNFGLLFVIKYIPKSGLLLPMGMSFYMFGASGYVIDCYRKKYEAEKNFLRFVLFISFFPQMIQGPINRYNDLGSQLKEEHSFNADEVKYGIQLMMWGYFKKLVIANRVLVFVSSVYNEYLSYGGALYLLATICSCLQLYCDFSGGIDIVSGAAQCLGIHLPLNFKRPIFAGSLTDYWQRWHITLSAWLKDYLFFPLAFSKPFIRLGEFCRKNIKGRIGKIVPTTIASFVVYFVIGIWHGAGTGYMAFGAFNAVLITISNLFPVLLKTPKWFGMIRTWVLVVISEFMIRAESFRTGMRMLSNVFTNFAAKQLDISFVTDSCGLSRGDLCIIILGFLVILIVECIQEKGFKIRASLSEKSVAVQWLCLFALMFAIFFFGFVGGNAVDAGFIYGAF